ncbi:hypothetical protein V5887_000347 [Klebsiella aerogenes]
MKKSPGVLIPVLHTQQAKKEALRIVYIFSNYEVGAYLLHQRAEKIQLRDAAPASRVVVVQIIQCHSANIGIPESCAERRADLSRYGAIELVGAYRVDRVIERLAIELDQVFQSVSKRTGPAGVQGVHFFKLINQTTIIKIVNDFGLKVISHHLK